MTDPERKEKRRQAAADRMTEVGDSGKSVAAEMGEPPLPPSAICLCPPRSTHPAPTHPGLPLLAR